MEDEIQKHFRFMLEAKLEFEKKNYKKALELYEKQYQYLEAHQNLNLPNMAKILSMLDFCMKMTKAEVAKMDNKKMDDHFDIKNVKLAFQIAFDLNIFLAHPDHPQEIEDIFRSHISELLPIEKYNHIHALMKLLFISKNSKGMADLLEVEGMEGFENPKEDLKNLMNSDKMKGMINTVKDFFGAKELGNSKSPNEEKESNNFAKTFLYMSNRVNLINELRSKLTLDFPLAIQLAFKIGENFALANDGGFTIRKFDNTIEEYIKEARSFNYPEEIIHLLVQLDNANSERKNREICKMIFAWFASDFPIS